MMVAIFLTWTFIAAPDASEVARQKAIQDSLALIEKVEAPSLVGERPETQAAEIQKLAIDTLPDSLKALAKSQEAETRLGEFSSAGLGEEKFITIKTDKLSAKFSTKGARLVSLGLNEKEYVCYDSSALFFHKEDPENVFQILFSLRGERQRVINSGDLFFEPIGLDKSEVVLTGDETLVLPFRAMTKEGKYLELRYTFSGNRFDYKFNVDFVGLDDKLKDRTYELVWISKLPVTEKTVEEIRKKAAVFYREGDDVESLNAMKEERQTYQAAQGGLDFISFNSQFFAHTLLAPTGKPFSSFDIAMETPTEKDWVKKMEANVRIPRDTASLTFYAGPLEYYGLRKYDRKMDRMLNLGWGPLKWINAWIIIPVFKLLENAVGNYGIIIFILGVLIKLITLPFTHKTYISMAKMRIANTTPEIKALDEKHKDDAMKLQQEKMALYRKLGANPMGGCVPMLLQYPILISMFFFFPQSIELRQQGFLWADDLSTYDTIWDFGFVPIVHTIYGDHVSLWTLLMTVSIFIYTWVNQKSQGSAMTSAPGMKYFPYFMPFLLLGFLNNYSAGLSYYYFLSNLLSIAQTQLTRYFVDDNKILDQLREFEKKKGSTRGKGWLQEWAAKQQKKQREVIDSKRRK